MFRRNTESMQDELQTLKKNGKPSDRPQGAENTVKLRESQAKEYTEKPRDSQAVEYTKKPHGSRTVDYTDVRKDDFSGDNMEKLPLGQEEVSISDEEKKERKKLFFLLDILGVVLCVLITIAANYKKISEGTTALMVLLPVCVIEFYKLSKEDQPSGPMHYITSYPEITPEMYAEARTEDEKINLRIDESMRLVERLQQR